jgi:hypothetical protein
MRPAVAAVLIASLALAGCTPVGGPPQPGSSAAGDQLSQLTVAAARPMTGYSRDRFPHWRKLPGSECDTRDEVLKRDGTNVKADRFCKITSGSWRSLYDSKTVTDPQTIDIDHTVALANAWRSGADTWTTEQRTEFANDMVRPQLQAVSRTVNRAKGDQDPSQWRPPTRGYWCDYARRWIAVKHHWALTVTEREKTALQEMVRTCPEQSSAPQTSSPAPAAS